MEHGISAAILAGGAGKRLGGINKSAQEIGGVTILSRMLSVISGLFNEIILVAKPEEETYRQYGLLITPDVITGKGPLAGIHSALIKASNNVVFVFAGDMPFLDESIIKRQLEWYYEYKPDILVPRMGDLIEPLHSIYSKKVTPALENYLRGSNRHAVRDFLLHAGAEYFELDASERINKAFMNVNSLADIVLAEEILRKDKT